MPLSLPDPLLVYFQTSNGSDAAQLAHCFTLDAIVVDAGQTYKGQEAIQSWKREARKKFAYTVEPVSVTREADRLTVTAEVVGNFPGSPVQLDHVFVMAGDRIRSLEIG